MKLQTTYHARMIALVSAIAGALLPLAPLHAGGERCIADWSEAKEIVEQRNMVDVVKLSVLARAKLSGNIMTARLCSRGDNYFYRLVIRGDDGRMQRIEVDAVKPFG